MINPGDFATTFQQTVGQCEHFFAMAKNHLNDQIQSQKDGCFDKSKNADEFVKCVKPFEVALHEQQIEYKLKNTYFAIRLDKCVKRAEENQIHPCLKKLNKMIAPYILKFE